MVVKIAMSMNSNLTDSGYDFEEQNEIYQMVLRDVYDNPRWYLDNLDSLKSFKVGWHFYNSSATNIPALREHMVSNTSFTR